MRKRNDRRDREGRYFLARPLGYSRHPLLSCRTQSRCRDRILLRFSQRFDDLRDFPLLGPDRSELRASMRGLLMDGYIAFYIVEPDRIVIVRVVDGRMDAKREISA